VEEACLRCDDQDTHYGSVEGIDLYDIGFFKAHSWTKKMYGTAMSLAE
jgi:hypothetical protein